MQRWVLQEDKEKSIGSSSSTSSCVMPGQFARLLAAGPWALRLQPILPAAGCKEVLVPAQGMAAACLQPCRSLALE